MRAATILAALVMLGCAPDIREGYYGCAADTDCPDGWTCRTDGRCWQSAGSVDAATPDGAAPDGGTDACVPIATARDVDLLVMVDKSASMVEEQAALAGVFPQLINGLATGDVDGDGTREFEPISSLQVGVVTSDMGALGNTVPTCDTRLGDDGVLVDEPLGGIGGCAASYPSFLEFTPGDSVSSFAADFGCLATVGTFGCGVRAAARVRAQGHGAGRVGLRLLRRHGRARRRRQRRVLARGLAADHRLPLRRGGLQHPRPRTSSTLRPAAPTRRPISTFVATCTTTCSRRPSATSRASARSARTRATSSTWRLVGLPLSLQTETYQNMLDHPDMAYDVAPDGRGPLPTCMGDSGAAFPGRRYIEVARGLDDAGAATVVRSICEPDFSAPVRALLEAVAPRLRARACE